MLIESLQAECNMMRDIQRRNGVTSLAYAGFADFVVAHGTAFTGHYSAATKEDSTLHFAPTIRRLVNSLREDY